MIRNNKPKKLSPLPFTLYPSDGFTLIELITAIGIIAVLAATTIAVLNPLEQFSKAQDSKRKSDLAQIQRGLESYYQDHQKYPTSCSGLISKVQDSCANADIVGWGATWPPYMDVLPIDPTATKNYGYWSDASNGNQSYALYASLDRGGKDPQACNGGAACANASFNTIWCGAGNIICTYGVSSPNIAP